nr:MAG TPA_asm: hypothetical protein [Caudoviricetes sp.]
MVKLEIQNCINGDIKHLEKTDKTIYWLICELKGYDEEKWKHGKTYEFETLKELQVFVDSCDIDFTDESKDSFSGFYWYEIVKRLYIDTIFEDNTMILSLGISRKYRD